MRHSRNNSKTTEVSLALIFDPNHTKYKFCCELAPSRYGCWLVACLELFLLTTLFINESATYFRNYNGNNTAVSPNNSPFSPQLSTVSTSFQLDIDDYDHTPESMENTHDDIAPPSADDLSNRVVISQIDNSPTAVIVSGSMLTVMIMFAVCLLLGVEREMLNMVFVHMVFQVFRTVCLIVTTIILTFALADQITKGTSEEEKTFGLICIFVCIFVIGVEVWLFNVVLAFYRYLVDKLSFDANEKAERGPCEV